MRSFWTFGIPNGAVGNHFICQDDDQEREREKLFENNDTKIIIRRSLTAKWHGRLGQAVYTYTFGCCWPLTCITSESFFIENSRFRVPLLRCKHTPTSSSTRRTKKTARPANITPVYSNSSIWKDEIDDQVESRTCNSINNISDHLAWFELSSLPLRRVPCIE